MPNEVADGRSKHGFGTECAEVPFAYKHLYWLEAFPPRIDTLSKRKASHGLVGPQFKQPGNPPGSIVATMSLKVKSLAVSQCVRAAPVSGFLHSCLAAFSVKTFK